MLHFGIQLECGLCVGKPTQISLAQTKSMPSMNYERLHRFRVKNSSVCSAFCIHAANGNEICFQLGAQKFLEFLYCATALRLMQKAAQFVLLSVCRAFL